MTASTGHRRHLSDVAPLQVLVPKLRELVDTEEKWLEEQDKLKEEQEREEKEAAAAAGAVWEEEGPAPDAPEEAAEDAAEDAAPGSPKHLSRNSTLKASLKPPPKKKRNQKPPVAETLADADANVSDGGNATLAGAAAAATNAAEAEEESRIDSPWATEIEELDDTVHAMQTESKALNEEVAALETGGVVFTSAKAQGPARQVLPDAHFLQKEVLGESYIKCQKVSRQAGGWARRQLGTWRSTAGAGPHGQQYRAVPCRLSDSTPRFHLLIPASPGRQEQLAGQEEEDLPPRPHPLARVLCLWLRRPRDHRRRHARAHPGAQRPGHRDLGAGQGAAGGQAGGAPPGGGAGEL